MFRRVMPLRDQRVRARELAGIAARRRLTPTEQAEADNLAHRAYMRTYRQL